MANDMMHEMTHQVTRNVVSEVHLNSLLQGHVAVQPPGMRPTDSKGPDFPEPRNWRQHTLPCFTMLLMSLWFWKDSPIAVLQCIHFGTNEPSATGLQMHPHALFGSTFGSSRSCQLLGFCTIGQRRRGSCSLSLSLHVFFEVRRTIDCNQKIHCKTKLFCFCFLFYCCIASILGHGMD